MDIERLLNATKAIVPCKITSASINPEKLSPAEIEKVTLASLEEAIPSILPGAKATLIGGQMFPDIIVDFDNEVEGIEVKSTRSESNPWSVTGGSIMEGNRIERVNDVWVMFTRLAGKVETKTRPYVDAVRDLAVTHSPRYILDMESPKEQGLFAKLKISYEDVRKSNSPFDFFRKYLANKAKEGGGHPWWSETESEVTAPPLIRFWGDLKKDEKNRLLAEAFVFFAEDILYGKHMTKYKGFAMHLMKKHSVICKGIRDPFSSGGKKSLFQDVEKVPAVFKILLAVMPYIKELVISDGCDGTSSLNIWKKNMLILAARQKCAILERILKDYA